MMGWTPPERGEILVIARPTKVTRTKGAQPMSTVTIAVDLAKNVFELAITGRAGTIRQRKRLSRARVRAVLGYAGALPRRDGGMCQLSLLGSLLRARGFAVTLLPPHYVSPYRRRNKTDR